MQPMTGSNTPAAAAKPGLEMIKARMAARLADAGLSPAAIEAMVELDGAMFQWQRMVLKGEATGRILAESGLGLELPQFHALLAVLRIRHGIGRPAPQDPTIGLMAEEMNIDPSRASRIAADLIRRGFLRREAVQDDGRKSVLRLTGQADAALEAFRELRWQRFPRVFAGWTEDEITGFAALFRRYLDGMAAAYRAPVTDGGSGQG